MNVAGPLRQYAAARPRPPPGRFRPRAGDSAPDGRARSPTPPSVRAPARRTDARSEWPARGHRGATVRPAAGRPRPSQRPAPSCSGSFPWRTGAMMLGALEQALLNTGMRARLGQPREGKARRGDAPRCSSSGARAQMLRQGRRGGGAVAVPDGCTVHVEAPRRVFPRRPAATLTGELHSASPGADCAGIVTFTTQQVAEAARAFALTRASFRPAGTRSPAPTRRAAGCHRGEPDGRARLTQTRGRPPRRRPPPVRPRSSLPAATRSSGSACANHSPPHCHWAPARTPAASSVAASLSPRSHSASASSARASSSPSSPANRARMASPLARRPSGPSSSRAWRTSQ